ncbi:GNAT family N-acetyltransferase [Lentzea xinjiangensis]|uniref:GNAT family N-acetyltransferase n=1 Tax=Lentzea xinjiangensis TaxID=402600 RepID=UPI001C4324F7|nr:GNAT family N-acetyltransferase [Lentzea xinjiangensis]
MPTGLAEMTEVGAYAAWSGSSSPDHREAMGISSLRRGAALGTTLAGFPSFMVNRVGTGEPLGTDDITAFIGFFREQGVPQAAFMVAPPLRPDDWQTICKEHDLTAGPTFVKLGAEVKSALDAADGLAGLDNGLHVGRVGPEHAREYAEVMINTFGLAKPGMLEVAEACVGAPGWEQYAVWQSDRIIAVGSVWFNGDCADMFGGATLPDHRQRGAQSALITARLRAARAAGCRWAVAETGAEAPGEHNPSLHNLQRQGFQTMYERTTWLWEPER